MCHTHTIEFYFPTGLSLRVLGETSPQPKVVFAHVRDAYLHLHVVEGRLARYLGQLVLAGPRVKETSRYSPTRAKYPGLSHEALTLIRRRTRRLGLGSRN